MKTYDNRRPPFLWKRQPPSELYIVLNATEAEQYKNRFLELRQKVRVRANQFFGRNATPQLVKVCDEKCAELIVIHRTPPPTDKAEPVA